MILVVFLTTVLTVYLVQWFIQKKQFHKFADCIPMERTFPFMGHLHILLFKNIEERLNCLHDVCLKYPKLTNVWLGPTILYIFVNDPEYIQKVLLSPDCLEKPFFYTFVGLGSGLITAKAEVWKVHRKLLNYAFSLKIIQSFIPTFVVNAQKLVENISIHVDQSAEFDILDHTLKCACDMISETSFGSKGIDVKKDVLNQSLHKYCAAVGTRFASILLYSETIYRRTRLYKEQNECRKLLNPAVDNLVEERKVILKEKASGRDSSTNTEEDEGIPTRRIFIDHLISNEEKFSDEEKRDQIYTLFGAGFETTGSQTANAILLLALHPEIQEKAANEIQQVFYSNEVEIDFDNIMKLDYLDRVIKESLRLCPTVPIIARETLAPITLGEFEIPAGITLGINFFALHRRPDIWGDDVQEFNPDRFTLENSEKRHPFSFLPFSGGPRNCIGNRYAMMSMKISLVHMLKNYRFTSSLKFQDLRFLSVITLKLCGEHLVSIERRK